MGAQYAAELKILLVYFAANLRILLVYLSESLGRLGQNGGALEGHIFHWGAAALLAPHRTVPGVIMMQRCTACPYLPFNFHTRKQTHFDDL